jgi:hypothetical protein
MDGAVGVSDGGVTRSPGNAELVRMLVGKGTGQREIEIAGKIRNSPLSPLWARATASANEAVWNRLPMDALKAIEQRAAEVDVAEMTFLADAATQGTQEAVAAVRLLASLGEEGFVPMDRIRSLLREVLARNVPAIRIAVVHAFWQMGDGEGRTALQEAIGVETDAVVRSEMEHVLRVLA